MASYKDKDTFIYMNREQVVESLNRSCSLDEMNSTSIHSMSNLKCGEKASEILEECAQKNPCIAGSETTLKGLNLEDNSKGGMFGLKSDLTDKTAITITRRKDSQDSDSQCSIVEMPIDNIETKVCLNRLLQSDPEACFAAGDMRDHSIQLASIDGVGVQAGNLAQQIKTVKEGVNQKSGLDYSANTSMISSKLSRKDQKQVYQIKPIIERRNLEVVFDNLEHQSNYSQSITSDDSIEMEEQMEELIEVVRRDSVILRSRSASCLLSPTNANSQYELGFHQLQ